MTVDGAMIQEEETDMEEQPRGAELIVAGDLNTDLEKMGVWERNKEIAEEVTTAGLEDLLVHLRPRQRARNRYRITWMMVRQGREVRYWTDCTVGSNCRIFQNVAVRDPRHNSDHYMVMRCLQGAYPREDSD